MASNVIKTAEPTGPLPYKLTSQGVAITPEVAAEAAAPRNFLFPRGAKQVACSECGGRRLASGIRKGQLCSRCGHVEQRGVMLKRWA